MLKLVEGASLYLFFFEKVVCPVSYRDKEIILQGGRLPDITPVCPQLNKKILDNLFRFRFVLDDLPDEYEEARVIIPEKKFKCRLIPFQQTIYKNGFYYSIYFSRTARHYR
jgi:hypothetical protein